MKTYICHVLCMFSKQKFHNQTPHLKLVTLKLHFANLKFCPTINSADISMIELGRPKPLTKTYISLFQTKTSQSKVH